MGMLVSFVRPVGGSQFDYVENFDPRIAGAAAALSANVAYLSAIRVAKAVRVTSLKIYVGTQSGNVDVGIYDSTDGGNNLTRLASSGSTAVGAGTAVQTLTLSAAVNLLPSHTYWFALALDNAVAQVHRASTSGSNVFGMEGNCQVSKAASFPLPNPIASPSGTTNMPWLRTA